MKKTLSVLILLIAISFSTKSQSNLKFDKRFVESEDRWVAFKMQKDSTYAFGFIYIDQEAGLTFNSEGYFKISLNGTFELVNKLEKINVKMRLQPNNNKVAFIPESKYSELKIQSTPEWLKSYKTDTVSAEHFYRWGYLYNSWDEAEKALTFLERAKKINPKFKGLEFEFAYAYNVLQEYDKAIVIIDSALINEPYDCYLLKEKTYAEIHSNKIDNAIITYGLIKKHCDKEFQQESEFNIAAFYCQNGIKDKFKRWSKKLKKSLKKDSPYYKALIDMQANLDKKK